MKSSSHIRNNKTGATMIELMAVLAIMGLGIGALLQTIVSGIEFARDTENNIKAINIARE
jgi:prepilin-type N-terminal cleavage/methylation domain-containing protein